jgi:hypothetical protein
LEKIMIKTIKNLFFNKLFLLKLQLYIIIILYIIISFICKKNWLYQVFIKLKLDIIYNHRLN